MINWAVKHLLDSVESFVLTLLRYFCFWIYSFSSLFSHWGLSIGRRNHSLCIIFHSRANGLTEDKATFSSVPKGQRDNDNGCCIFVGDEERSSLRLWCHLEPKAQSVTHFQLHELHFLVIWLITGTWMVIDIVMITFEIGNPTTSRSIVNLSVRLGYSLVVCQLFFFLFK